MRYFYNPLNGCKYATSSKFYIDILVNADYEEISEKKFNRLEDVF